MRNLAMIKNAIRSYLDPELREIRGIVREYQDEAPINSDPTQKCDQIFTGRLLNNPQAFKMSFWSDHFEWRAVADYPEMQGTLLDFGCGSGHSDILLARTGWYVHGVDMSPLGIRIANHLKNNESEKTRERLTFTAVDITKDLPSTELFDSAWSSNVFEHIAEPRPILRGLRAWLKPGAFLLVSVPFRNAYDDPGHVNHFYNGPQLRDYFNNELAIVRIQVSEQHQMIRALCRFT